jgi:phosphomannomutase
LTKAFGTAGVRGVFNKTQTPSEVYNLAETCAFVFGRGSYGVGWDGRKTSALLARTISASVNAVGSDVYVFGEVPTPVVAFGTRSRSCMAGFSVTASHNPSEFSGVKIFGGNGMELAKQDEERIERSLELDVMKSSGRFGLVKSDAGVIDDYVNGLVSRYEIASNPLRIAVDCASGPGAYVTPRILKMLGHVVTALNAQVSWRFPAHQPEPTKDNLSDFVHLLPSLRVDVGFAHDGDADRLVMVDGFGNIIPDSIMSIIALRGLGASSGSIVISESTSCSVEEEARQLGFDVVRSRLGKTFAILEKEGGVFATEPSKIVDPRWGYWEDGINAAALISGVLSRERGLLERMMNQTKWHYRQVNCNVAVRMPTLMRNAKDMFRSFKIEEERTLDGYKLVFSDGSWILFRPSGTEPKARIYCESKEPELLNILIQEGIKCVESSL